MFIKCDTIKLRCNYKYLKEMKPGSVFVDVAVDQGGCGETTKVTYHDDPIYIEDGVAHLSVPQGNKYAVMTTGIRKTELKNLENEDMESVLDDCLAVNMPQRHLTWHYRSKHESLIAFSNGVYYDNRLCTFPSPDALASKARRTR